MTPQAKARHRVQLHATARRKGSVLRSALVTQHVSSNGVAPHCLFVQAGLDPLQHGSPNAAAPGPFTTSINTKASRMSQETKLGGVLYRPSPGRHCLLSASAAVYDRGSMNLEHLSL
jgi:hypothetical protein